MTPTPSVSSIINASEIPDASSPEANNQPSSELNTTLSLIEVLAGIGSVVVAITIYKLTMRNRAVDATVDVEMNDLPGAPAAREDQLHSVRPDPFVSTLPMPPFRAKVETRDKG